MDLAASNPGNHKPVASLNALAPWLPFLLLPVGAVAARLVLSQGWFSPQCLLRKFTGIPCPSCGCTRSLAAWSYLDFEQAFRFNPLFFLVCAGMLLWFGARAMELLSRQKFLPNLRLTLREWPLWKIGAALVALNWLYLCLALPK